jgi:phage tail sheath protein FI
VQLSGGTYVPAARDDFLAGLDGLGINREISLVSIPDEVVIPELADDLVSHCETLRDRFAILAEQTDGADLNQTQQPRDSSYAAIYYPRVRVPAPHLRDGNVLVPPQGHLAGIYGRVDREHGVHRAPANQVVQGLSSTDPSSGLEPLSHILGKAEQDVLGPRGINVLRDFPSSGRGIRVWGARTISADSDWKYVNVRRLFIFLEQSIGQGLQWVVFEPNSEQTWIRVRQSVMNFLRTVWRNGALMGFAEDQAFFVRCDRTTMTQDDIDNGRLICLIGVAPVKPAEFVIFRIMQKTLPVS